MTSTKEMMIKPDHLLHLRRFFEQLELEDYYPMIVEKLKVRDRILKKKKCEQNKKNPHRMNGEKESRERETIEINQSSFFFARRENFKWFGKKETMARILFNTMPKWMKCQEEKTVISPVRKVTKH